MSFRRDAGAVLAAGDQCKSKGRIVRVPSRSKPGTFHLVNLTNEYRPKCGCKDSVVNNQVCAHIWAARFFLQRESPDSAPSPVGERRKTYHRRSWRNYNLAEVKSPTIARLVLAYLAENLTAFFKEGKVT